MPARWEPWPANRNAVFPVTAVPCSPSSVARCSNCERDVASATATSPSGTSGFAASQSRKRSAWPCRASGVFAETTSGSGGAGTAGETSTAGASSRITWAFVPLIPNEETPARRARSVRGQGSDAVSSWTSPADQSTCGEGASACRVGGSCSCCKAITILITPATPAAACA